MIVSIWNISVRVQTPVGLEVCTFSPPPRWRTILESDYSAKASTGDAVTR